MVLLDVMMPGMDGFEVCRRIKGSPKTMHVPVVMVTALDQTSDKVQGLEAGADDFLTKPVDDIALITRVKNLARLKTLNDEMMLRMATGAEIGVLPGGSPAWPKTESGGRVLLVEDHERVAKRMRRVLGKMHEVDVEPDLQAALLRLGEKPYDLLIVSLSLAGADGLRLCSQVRSLERTRHLPIIVMVQPGDEARLLRALDMGVNDYLTRPVDRNELLARVRTQIKRKRHSDYLRDRLEESVELAVTDALTGLHNRRYMETHLTALAEQAESDRPAAVAAARRHRQLQVHQRHLRPRRRRQRAARVRRPLPPQHPRHRSGLPHRRRGVRHRHARQRPGAGAARWASACARASPPSRSRPTARRGCTVTASVGIATLDQPHDSLEALLQAGRPGALRGQARRAQPRGRGRGLSCRARVTA